MAVGDYGCNQEEETMNHFTQFIFSFLLFSGLYVMLYNCSQLSYGFTTLLRDLGKP